MASSQKESQLEPARIANACNSFLAGVTFTFGLGPSNSEPAQDCDTLSKSPPSDLSILSMEFFCLKTSWSTTRTSTTSKPKRQTVGGVIAQRATMLWSR